MLGSVVEYAAYGCNIYCHPKPKMLPEMWMPLLVMMLGFYCLFGLLTILRNTCNVILARERRSQRVKRIG